MNTSGSGAGFGVREEIVAQTQTLLRSNVDPAVISMIDASIQNIVDRYEALGPHHLAPDARLLRGTLVALLNGLQPPRARSELFSMAAKAAGLLGYMSVNAGASYAVTDAYCAEAEQLADEAGRSDLQAWAHGTRSLGLYYAGRYAEADAAAEAGIELAPSSVQAIRLLINGRARALARLGRRKDAERAISQAFELSDQQATLPDGLTACIDFAPYSRARTLANAITAHLSLGDASKVLHYADEIEGLIEQANSDWSRALVRLDVATALLRQRSPEVEHAMALGRSALRAGSARPIRSVWQRALELHDQAGPWHRQHAVAEFGDELRSWRSQPQAELVAAAGD
jgi:tetratricopeptide (TPR) repeat protein